MTDISQLELEACGEDSTTKRTCLCGQVFFAKNSSSQTWCSKDCRESAARTCKKYGIDPEETELIHLIALWRTFDINILMLLETYKREKERDKAYRYHGSIENDGPLQDWKKSIQKCLTEISGVLDQRGGR